MFLYLCNECLKKKERKKATDFVVEKKISAGEVWNETFIENYEKLNTASLKVVQVAVKPKLNTSITVTLLLVEMLHAVQKKTFFNSK